MLHELQSRFRQATTGRDDGPLRGLLAANMPATITPARRIAVHRNTYFGSLIEALAAACPVTEQLVGPHFFAAAARGFIEQNPPQKPDLAGYGGGFGDFLASFPPAAALPWLADTARLEWARVEASFAAEAEPLDPAALADLPADGVAGLRLVLHPSARLFQSRWAVHSVWEAHQSDPVAPFDPAAGAENLLLLRPADRMHALRLSNGEAALVRALLAGATLGDAAAAALAADPTTDLQTALARLFSHQAFIAAAGDAP